MTFCGQCGLQIPPGRTVCPRCGSPTEPEMILEDFRTDDPTIISFSHSSLEASPPDLQRPGEATTPSEQQKLILRPDGSAYDPNRQIMNEPKSILRPQTYGRRTPAPYSNPNPDTAYANNTPINRGSHPDWESSYPNYAPQAGIDYQPYRGQYAAESAQRAIRRGRGWITVLFIVLPVLLLIAGAIALFALQRHPSSNVLSPSQKAQAVISQYYTDINNRNYRDAYNLWSTNPQPYDQFASGYANTRRDDITFDNITPLSDGTISVTITISATEDISSGTRVSTYKGNYIVGAQKGIWKILSGNFQQTG